jgi:hypothetical protein
LRLFWLVAVLRRVVLGWDMPGLVMPSCCLGMPGLPRECLDRILIAGPRHLAHVLGQYTEHYDNHRPHRSLDQRPPAGRTAPPPTSGSIRHLRRDRLGGLIHEYLQVA